MPSSVETYTSADQVPEHERPLVWIDGELRPRSQAMVSVFDHGFLYGDGVFEGIRVYRGQIFKCASHVKRIFRNMRAVFMDQQSPEGRVEGGGAFRYTEAEITEAMEKTVAANGIEEGYIRLIFSRGIGSLGLHPFHCPKPGVIIIADTIRLYPPEMYEAGMKVIVAERPRIPIECLDPKLKPMNYLNNILAKVEAIDAGVLEAIMLRYTDDESVPREERFVGECTGDNIFIIKDGGIVTPPLEVGMLDGVTRAFVVNELAPNAGVPVEQRWITLGELLEADEIFLTGTAAEMIAVSQVEDRVITEGEGPITAKLRGLFREAVTADVVPTD
ncbi:MAG: aminotransferase class IV [Planctomycetota bacterium]